MKGKNIMITGASFGIGRTIATLLATQGVKLILYSRRENRLKEILKHDIMWDAETCLKYGLVDEIV